MAYASIENMAYANGLNISQLAYMRVRIEAKKARDYPKSLERGQNKG